MKSQASKLTLWLKAAKRDSQSNAMATTGMVLTVMKLTCNASDNWNDAVGNSSG